MAVTINDQSRPTENHNYPSLPRTAIPAAYHSSLVPSMDDKHMRRAIKTTLPLSLHLPPTCYAPLKQVLNDMA